MKRPGSPPGLLFRLIVPATAVFVVTILATIACLFGDPRAPVARWFEAHVNKLLLGELVAVVVLSLLAMTVDRIRTLRNSGKEDP
ncbi:MAG: hypothetical protein R3C19_05325 [Planctomycetaceae bacterium]